MSNSQMHDSGERRTFETGAVRDMARDKSRPDLISPFATDRLGRWLALGAQKYAERNWEKGLPIGQCIASLERHLVAYKAGKVEEDHLAAVMCNAMFIAHYEHEIEAGRLPASLDDLPRYEQQSGVLLKVEKPQAGFSMTFEKCASSPGPEVATEADTQTYSGLTDNQLDALASKSLRIFNFRHPSLTPSEDRAVESAIVKAVNDTLDNFTVLVDEPTYSGWTDDQLDKLVDVLYDIFGFQEHMAITPDIAAQVAEAVDEINWQIGHVDPLPVVPKKPTWTQYTGEYTVDLERLRKMWYQMEFIAPPLSRAALIAATKQFTLDNFHNILFRLYPKKLLSSELDDLLDKANALDDNSDHAQHETLKTWVKIMCEHVPDDCRSCPDLYYCYPAYEVSIDKAVDSKSIATFAILSRDAPGLESMERDVKARIAAQDGDAVPVEDLGFSIVQPDHPKTHGIPYWIKPATIKLRRRPRAYLAGPMRGYKMFNFPAFKLATTLWTIRGYDVTSPADMDGDFDNIDPIHNPAIAEGSTSEGLKGMSRAMVNRDIETIRNLDSEQGDALIVLPGWRKSVGATAEVALARWLGLTCYDALEGQIVEDK